MFGWQIAYRKYNIMSAYSNHITSIYIHHVHIPYICASIWILKRKNVTLLTFSIIPQFSVRVSLFSTVITKPRYIINGYNI